ncbi:MAG: 16S rRNA (guanine(527)-N(7))-methyltransferase RsmG [Pseudomonadota bacterium]
MPDQLEDLLVWGLGQLGVSIPEYARRQLFDYLALLQKWNGAYNLTAVRQPRAMVVRHLLDSLALLPLIDAHRYIDVGTGGGVPGVPLAIACPDREFHLLDSNGKKTRFLFQVKTALGLDNMTVHHARVETFQPEQLFDVVLSRAFASLSDMVSQCGHLLPAGGHFMAMKGGLPEAELAVLPAAMCRLEKVHSLTVPALEEQRHVVKLARL